MNKSVHSELNQFQQYSEERGEGVGWCEVREDEVDAAEYAWGLSF